MSVIGNPILLGGGENNAGYALIMATYPAGSVITCSNGTTTLTGDTSGEYTFKVEKGGDWSLTITDGIDTTSQVITITDGVIEDTEAGIYEVRLDYIKIYGVSWDGTSTTAWTRTDDAASFTDPVPYVAGAISYGSPFDNCYPWCDMTIVEDEQAGTMVKIPKFWYKLTQNGVGISIQIATQAKDGYSVCPACMDRGDGNGEHDYALVGRYHCASTYKSITGEKPLTGKTCPTFRSGIQSLGTGIYMLDWATRFTIWLLYLVEFADWNSQASIGYGCGNGSSKENMGYTDNMPYHTGTIYSNRTTYGVSTQYHYIEGLWDNVMEFVDGGYCQGTNFYIILNPSMFNNSTNGTLIGSIPSGYPTSFSIKSIANTFPLFIPNVASGGTNITYSCDFWQYNSSGIIVGGAYQPKALDRGLFAAYGFNANSADSSVGARPMKFPS